MPELEGWRPWVLNDEDVTVATVEDDGTPRGGTPTGAVAGHVTTYDVPTEFTMMTIAQAGHIVPA